MKLLISLSHGLPQCLALIPWWLSNSCVKKVFSILKSHHFPQTCGNYIPSLHFKKSLSIPQTVHFAYISFARKMAEYEIYGIYKHMDMILIYLFLNKYNSLAQHWCGFSQYPQGLFI